MIGGGYGVREVFSVVGVALLHEAELLVARTPYLEPGGKEPVRCHELARAVERALQPHTEIRLRVLDGFFGFIGAVEHSWITLGEPARRRASTTILDVYVPGALPQVQIFCTSHALPLNHRPSTPRDDIRCEVVAKLLRLFEG